MSFFPSKTFPKKYFAGRFFPTPLGGEDGGGDEQPSVISTLDLVSNLFGNYQFDEGAGIYSANAANTSTFLTGSFLNTASFTPSGVNSPGARFNGGTSADMFVFGGTNHFLQVVSGFTLSLLYTPRAFVDYAMIFSAYNSVNRRLELHLGGAGFGNNSGINVALFYNATTGANGYITNQFILNRLYHLSLVFNPTGTNDAEKLLVYINGTPQSLTFTGTLGGLNFMPTISTPQTSIASRREGSAEHACLIDNLKMFSRNLTAEEVGLLSLERPSNNFSVNII